MTNERIEAIPTRWSLIRGAHPNSPANSVDEMRRMLVLRYAPAVKRYVAAIVREHEDAEELAQDVVLRLMRGDFSGANPEKGRFRDLLKTAIRNMIRNHWEKSNRRKTSDIGLDQAPGPDDDEQDGEWTAAWQRTVLAQTWDRLRNEEGPNASPGYWILRLRVDFPDLNSEELAKKLSDRTGTPVKADTGRQMLRRARKRFAETLMDEIRSGLDDESDERVQEELASLGLLSWMKDFMDP